VSEGENLPPLPVAVRAELEPRVGFVDRARVLIHFYLARCCAFDSANTSNRLAARAGESTSTCSRTPEESFGPIWRAGENLDAL